MRYCKKEGTSWKGLRKRWGHHSEESDGERAGKKRTEEEPKTKV